MSIVQMKKVSIVVLNSERKSSLKKLRKMGLVHLEEVEGKGPVLAAYKEAATTAEKALSILEEIKKPKKQQPIQMFVDSSRSDSIARELVFMSERKKSLLDSINQSTQELDRLSKWGVVNPADFKELAEKGLFFYMYEIPEDKYFLIGKDVKTILVNSVGKIARFLLLSEVELTERPAGLPAEAYAVPVPELSTSELVASIQNAESEISSIEHAFLENLKYHDSIAEYRKALATDIEFETIYSGMNHEELSGDGDSKSKSLEPDSVSSVMEMRRKEESASDGRLAWVTGYVPIDSLKDFMVACKQNDWAYAVSDPAEDDPVPTKLHNNKVVSIIYPLMDFLDVTPGYHEFDISGWFLLFFCMFFAMIFGDVGYGAIITLVGFILLAKSRKGARSLSVLITVLGLTTVVWGAMTCSWFGIDRSLLPSWMLDISFGPVSPAKIGEDAAKTNQQIFCFVLAIVQLSLAHIKCFIRDRKSLKCLGDLGSLMQLWGMFYVVMSMVVDSHRYPLLGNGAPIQMFGIEFPEFLPMICITVLAVGFVLSFVFSNYEGSIGKSVLESCKNIITVLLGIVNVFSDIVSYIRLWAVALAGAAISNTVNSMAGPMLGKLMLVLVAVILLVFGHGLNMILNVLSVIVHGVRLNTLEFSQHLGMTWSGIRYRPFKEGAEVHTEVNVESIGKSAAAKAS